MGVVPLCLRLKPQAFDSGSELRGRVERETIELRGGDKRMGKAFDRTERAEIHHDDGGL